MTEQAIIEGILRVEVYNNQFRQPNPKGRYPLCKPMVGPTNPMICERCGREIDTENESPCPAVLPENRWGEDWEEDSSPSTRNEGENNG